MIRLAFSRDQARLLIVPPSPLPRRLQLPHLKLDHRAALAAEEGKASDPKRKKSSFHHCDDEPAASAANASEKAEGEEGDERREGSRRRIRAEGEGRRERSGDQRRREEEGNDSPAEEGSRHLEVVEEGSHSDASSDEEEEGTPALSNSEVRWERIEEDEEGHASRKEEASARWTTCCPASRGESWCWDLTLPVQASEPSPPG